MFDFGSGQWSWIRMFSIFDHCHQSLPMLGLLLEPCSQTALHGVRTCFTSSDANKAHSPNPSFGYVAYLVACHYRKIIAKEKLPYDGRCASFCHLCSHSFETTLALFRRVLNVD